MKRRGIAPAPSLCRKPASPSRPAPGGFKTAQRLGPGKSPPRGSATFGRGKKDSQERDLARARKMAKEMEDELQKE